MKIKNSEAMRKNVFILAAAALLFAGCAKEAAEKFETVSYNTTIAAVMETADTKAALADNGAFTWQEGDKIAVYTSAKTFKVFTLTDGAGKNKAHFGGELADGETVTGPVVYPASLAPAYVAATEVKITFPEEFTYEAGNTNVPMTGILGTSTSNKGVAVFKQVGGVVKFSVAGIPDDATKLVVSARGSSLTGTYNTKGSAAVVATEAESSTVTINFTKTADAMDFYLPVPTGTYQNLGFSVQKADGTILAEKVAVVPNKVRIGELILMPAVTLVTEGLIANADQLEAFLATATKEDTKTYRIVADLDLTGKTLSMAKGFSGVLDGQGHILKNWVTSKALIDTLWNGGKVKNLVLDKSCKLSYPETIKDNLGFVVNDLYGEAIGLVNHANVEWTGTYGGEGKFGILIGQAYNVLPDKTAVTTLIKNCRNYGNLTLTSTGNTGGTVFIGTVVGRQAGNTTEAKMTGCYNAGDFTINNTVKSDKNFYIGGISGGNQNGCSNENCVNEGNVTFKVKEHQAALMLGGVTSYTTGFLHNCVNKGNITYVSEGAIKGCAVGGVAGYDGLTATQTATGITDVANCVNTGNISVSGAQLAGRNTIGDLNGTKSTSTGTAGVGGIIGYTVTGFSMSGCSNSGSVSYSLSDQGNGGTAETPGRFVLGGLVGDGWGPIRDGKNTGNVAASIRAAGGSYQILDSKGKAMAGNTTYIGGIVGSGYYSKTQTTLEVKGCENTGSVSLHSDNTAGTNHAIGGIVGWPGKETQNGGKMIDCINRGDVSASGNILVRAGGISGGTGAATGCSNYGKVTLVGTTLQDNSTAGGIFGLFANNSDFKDCENYGDVQIEKIFARGIGGLVGNFGNNVGTITGSVVNCQVIAPEGGIAGMIGGRFQGDSEFNFGSAESPIKVGGTLKKGETATVITAEQLTKDYMFGDNVQETHKLVNVQLLSGEITFVEHLESNFFVYHGKKYPVVKLADGKWWMAAPLAYVPEGKTVSSDPKADAGIWYTYTSDGKTATARTDFTDGYLYDYPTAFGVKQDDITYGTRDEYKSGEKIGNFRTFEGTQGVCPPGWYIPTRADFLKLVGASTKDDSNGEKAEVNDPTALYYDTSISGGGSTIKKFNEAGWNFAFLGIRSKTSTSQAGAYNLLITDDTKYTVAEFLGKPSLNQIMTSTPYMPNVAGNNVQYFCLMTTFTKAYQSGRLSLSYGNYLHGMEVRCVRKATE